MKRMLIGIDWLRKQPWSVRLTFSAAFASVSLIGWLIGYVWPWGLAMAIVPLVVPRSSGEEEDFLRPVKASAEAAPGSRRQEVAFEALPTFLDRLANGTASGFSLPQMTTVLDAIGTAADGETKRFQYVVMFAGRPTSLQLTLTRKGAMADVLITTAADLLAGLDAGAVQPT